MAILDADQKKSWKSSLKNCDSPWIAFGLPSGGSSLAEKMNGMPGLIDWHLHGQVSNLLAQGLLPSGEFCLIPNTSGQKHFLLYHYELTPDAKGFFAKLKKLKVTELCLAESTFPEDFLAKVKQTLTKEGIRCTKLEPDIK